jgi:hypothetical protein
LILKNLASSYPVLELLMKTMKIYHLPLSDRTIQPNEIGPLDEDYLNLQTTVVLVKAYKLQMSKIKCRR